MKKLYIFIVSLVLIVSCNSDDDTQCTPTVINGSTTYWDEYLGHDETVDFWPDKYVNYWAVEVDKNDFPNIGFKIQGEFPNARYFSYNVYGTDRNSTASLFDTEIKSEVCSTNPFNNMTSETPGNNNLYTIFVVPESVSEFDTEDNVLKFIDGEDKITLMLRYYVPQGNDQAGVPLPTLEVFDLDTKEPVTIPETNDILTVTPQTLARIDAAYAFQIDNKVRFYRGDATGLYPNNDNKYVRTFLNFDNDDVYIIRWKSPIVPTNVAEYETAEVRYTSMNFGDNLTKNYDGIYDDETIREKKKVVIVDEKEYNEYEDNYFLKKLKPSLSPKLQLINLDQNFKLLMLRIRIYQCMVQKKCTLILSLCLRVTGVFFELYFSKCSVTTVKDYGIF